MTKRETRPLAEMAELPRPGESVSVQINRLSPWQKFIFWSYSIGNDDVRRIRKMISCPLSHDRLIALRDVLAIRVHLLPLVITEILASMFPANGPKQNDLIKNISLLIDYHIYKRRG